MVKKTASWSDVKASLLSVSKDELLNLLRDLYRLNSENRRYLHTRMVDTSAEFEWYRQRVLEAVAPEFTPYGQCEVSVSDAKSAIREYRLASCDVAGTLDLMFTSIESGIGHFTEYGYDDQDLLDSHANMLDTAIRMLREAGPDVQFGFLPRLKTIVEQSDDVGWGWGSVVVDLVTRDFPDLYAD